jgi:hypothetical protein
MNIDSLLKDLFESDIIAAVDISESIDQYIWDRADEVKAETEDYRRWGEEKKKLEAEFVELYSNKKAGVRQVLQYNDLCSYMEGSIKKEFFKQGFYEAVRLLIALIEVLYRRKSGEVKLQDQSQT